MEKNAAEVAHGPMFLGLLISVLLYGLLISQMYIYYTAYKQDTKWLKFYIFLLFVMETANVVFGCVYIYESLIVNFGNVEYLAIANWIFATEPALTAIITTYVQLFYAWRVWIVSGKFWLVVPIVMMSLMSGVTGLATSSAIQGSPRFVDFQSFQHLVIIWFAGECTTNILIATTMVWNLSNYKTGFHKSNEMVNRIIRLTVETGVLTTCATITHLVLYLVDHTGTHLLINFFIAKLYSNSLMSSLNSRRGITDGADELSTIQVDTGICFRNTSMPKVFIQEESYQMSDKHVEGHDKHTYDVTSTVWTG